MYNFILQVFKDLDHMIRNSLIISGKQKMSKREQNRKIAAVRKQISDLKSRVTKLQSCLCTLQEDPDQYFQNLNTDNRAYVDWKKDQNKSEKDEQNISSNEKKEEECRATTTSTRVADTFGFFSKMIRFFHSSASSVLGWEYHNPLLLHMDKLPLGTTHPTHILLGAVCPFHHWMGYFP